VTSGHRGADDGAGAAPHVIKHRATHTGWRRLRAHQSTVLCLLEDSRVEQTYTICAGREQNKRAPCGGDGCTGLVYSLGDSPGNAILSGATCLASYNRVMMFLNASAIAA
jgi:hypothetical protein